MRSREEVTVDGLRYVRTDGQWFAHPEGASWRIPQDDDKSRMLDRIRSLESPPRPEPVALSDIKHIRYWLNAYTDPASGPHFYGHGAMVNLLREYLSLRESHPSAAARAEWNAAIESAAQACENRARSYTDLNDTPLRNEALKCASAIRMRIRSGAAPALPVVELDEWRVVDNEGRTVKEYATEAAASGQPTQVFAQWLDSQHPDRAPHRVMRVCLRPVDSHQSVPSDYSEPEVPVVTEADENGDVWMSVSVGPVTVDEAVACLRRHGWTIDTAALTAASEVRG